MPGEATVIYFEPFRDNLFLKGISGITQCFLNPDNPYFILKASKFLLKVKSMNCPLSPMMGWRMRSLLLKVYIGTGMVLSSCGFLQVTCTPCNCYEIVGRRVNTIFHSSCSNTTKRGDSPGRRVL